MQMDPVAEIIAARHEARTHHDPHVDVCFLATVSVTGRPEVRAISLRDIDAKGFGVLINAHSPKWQQLTAHGQGSLHILWSTVRRQYRVYGRFEPMEPERLQQYWNRKGHASRLLEHYYETFEAQSRPIPSREHLLRGIEELKRRYPNRDAVPIPDSLKGLYLYPTEIDVWHGSPEDRLHDRRLCRRTADGWTFQILVP
jgi:pyridoxamine 5'-phosphate oxidase